MNQEHEKTHFHIRWSEKSTLDWERFHTIVEAEERARQIAHPGESYTIEQYGAACPQCMDMERMPERDSSNEVSP